jgi:hypothetical protein
VSDWEVIAYGTGSIYGTEAQLMDNYERGYQRRHDTQQRYGDQGARSHCGVRLGLSRSLPRGGHASSALLYRLRLRLNRPRSPSAWGRRHGGSACRHQTGLALDAAARQAGIPLLLGSAGTAGGAPHVAIVKDILCEIAAEEGLSFPLALIHTEQDKSYLKQRLREGRIKPLKSTTSSAPTLSSIPRYPNSPIPTKAIFTNR